MDEQAADRNAILAALPPVPAVEPMAQIRSLSAAVGRKLIVLDDDPTGTQTVDGVPVVTRWTVDHLARELEDPAPASYVLTNSRSLAEPQAVALARQIGANLRVASARTGRDFDIVSRSDSTLRGHFPAEVEALAAALGQSFDGWILCPFFEEGGRLTIRDVHYVAEGDRLVPAAQTPFARDPAFGFGHSNLRRWIAEKSHGRIGQDRIASLTIEQLRSGDADRLAAQLGALKPGSICIVNAACRLDLEVAVCALLKAEAAGRRFLYRTAASFVAVRAGLDRRPLLAVEELALSEGSGLLVVVGSHVPKTTSQLEHLLAGGKLPAVELAVDRLLDRDARSALLAETVRFVDEKLAADLPVVVFTSRKVVGATGPESLAIAQAVSQSLCELVGSLSVRPRALVAKGGITSSDLATKACNVERATVAGQIVPGVPVWTCGPESRFPAMPLVVFPGNVGPVTALTEVVNKLVGAGRLSRPSG